jgi:phosphatidylserine/phosphatidylglycerophosphate/cardiolipin synthase-like enzyme
MGAEASVPPARSGSYPLRAGNRVRPLVDGVPAFRRICEAVEAARRRVWATIAFVDRTAELPDGRGTLFDVLDRAVARGLDVRVVFWREPDLDPARPGWEHFPGNAGERAWLAERGSAFQARWDHLPRGCAHQKSWLVDAGEPGEVAFVGGINVDRMSIVDRGHRAPEPREHYHDVYAELRGPVATDVHHNFVQRWNGASERGREDGVWPPRAASGELAPPSRITPACGDVGVQLGRTLRPGSLPDVPLGEQSVLEQYVNAIDSARSAIYLENQFVASAAIFARLDAALRRGVEVVALVPRAPLEEVRAARRQPKSAALFEALAALGMHERFTLAGLVVADAPGDHRDVYVHAKIAIVDDAWATVGSANLDVGSLERNTEMNAAWWSATGARELRCDLLAEHLGEASAGIEMAAALARFRDVARANAERLARGDALRGMAVAIDPARYGE